MVAEGEGEEEAELVVVVVMLVVCCIDGPLEAWGCYAMIVDETHYKKTWLETDRPTSGPTYAPADRRTDGHTLL